MQLRRSENAPRGRRTRTRTTPRGNGRAWLVGTLAVIGILLLVARALALGKARASATAAAPDVAADTANFNSLCTAAAAASTVATAPISSQMVEVPSVAGLGLTEAKLVLEAAGLVVTSREAGAPVAKGQTATVTSQEPSAGDLAAPGDTVRLVVPPASVAAAKKPAAAKNSAGDGFVVCIDPGHQAHSNSTPEPIGPGSKTTKPSVSGGATGVSTGIPEYEIALQIAMNLKKRLEAQGVKVVMTRTVNDVDIVNSKRAAIANKAKADLFIRVHADGSPDSSVAGISTLYPASNKWTRSFAGESKSAAAMVQKAMIQSTGAVDRGAVKRSDLSGFNWATVPSVLVEAGFMSNRVEDKLLASPHYQDKLAEGIAAGAMKYLRASR